MRKQLERQAKIKSSADQVVLDVDGRKVAKRYVAAIEIKIFDASG
jgi:hypothetical protein